MTEAPILPRPIAVIGAGTMGSAMARRLLDQGHRLQVWNRSPASSDRLARLGAETSAHPQEAVKGAAVILTLLPTADVVSEIMIAQGVVDALTAGAVWAQMGTIGVEGTRQLDAEVRERRPDVFFVDAPVSGSRGPAEAGELVILASGPAQARGVADRVFSSLGRRTLWLGSAGMGSRVKLVLNTWLAFEVEAVAEVTALARRLGVPDAVLNSVTSGSPLVSPYAASKLAKMQSGDDSAEFALELALKDLKLASEDGGSETIPVADAIADRWRQLVDEGAGALDVSVARRGI